MASRLRGKLTYANVIATLALFMALGGGALAATELKKNSVGTKQIKNKAVTEAKIKNGAVSGGKLANGSVGGAQLQANSINGANVQDGSLTGADINQSTLNSVRASNVIGVAMNASCSPAVPFPPGVSATIAGTGCKVTFPSSVLDCAATATVGIRTSLLIIVEERTVQTIRNPLTPDVLFTDPSGGGSSKAEPVDLTVVC
jgi:hypothetical protein